MFPPDILTWGIAVILAIQSFASPTLDAAIRAVNILGTEDFYIVALGLLFWCLNRRTAIALVPIFLLADYSARVLKDLTAVPRPYDLDPRIRNLDPQTDLSFPSAAVTDVSAFWLFFAAYFRRAWLWVLAGAAIGLIALARMYLGVHYPTDVAGGALLGGLAVLLFLRVDFRRLALSTLSRGWPALLLVVPPLLAAAHPTDETATDMGVLMGLILAVAVEERYFPFSTNGPLWKQAAKIILGLGVALALRLGLKPVLPDEVGPTFVRYAIIGLWVGAAAPWLFIRLRWAEREKPVLREPAQMPHAPAVAGPG